MPYQTGIAKALAARGLRVETVSGWQSRGSSSFNPKGVTCHWTAGPRNAKGRPSLNVVTHGRKGLPGPLCNVYLDRNGVAVVVAAGRANHAGPGGWRGLSGNSSVFGIEAESGGDGDWTAAQREAYPKVVAALLDLTPDKDVRLVHGHNEWAPKRKIDIRDWTMDLMRSQVAAIMNSNAKPNPNNESEEDEDVAKNSGVFYELDGGKTVVYLLFNTASGWYHEFSNGSGRGAMGGTYVNPIARALDTPSWAKVTKGHADVIKKALSAVTVRTVEGSLTVEVEEPAE